MTQARHWSFIGAIALATLASTAFAQSKAEIQSMDGNQDGVVTRSEWQGQSGAFRLHDSNKDGVLSGTEVWEAKQTRGRRQASDEPFHDWTAGGFASLDRNNDRRIVADEWPFNRQGFISGDRNSDGVLTRAEFLSQGGTDTASSDRFRTLDGDRDGVIERSEWRDSPTAFTALDRNRDTVITREEYREVRATSGIVARSGAYRAGFDRGRIEGRAAGGEDRDRNQVWDLEGQRELEGADSGYHAGIGDRREYQTGYREGFRQAYVEGWERR